MADTTTTRMGIIATMLRGNPTLAPYAETVEVITAERDGQIEALKRSLAMARIFARVGIEGSPFQTSALELQHQIENLLGVEELAGEDA